MRTVLPNQDLHPRSPSLLQAILTYADPGIVGKCLKEQASLGNPYSAKQDCLHSSARAVTKLLALSLQSKYNGAFITEPTHNDWPDRSRLQTPGIDLRGEPAKP